ncbi:MAG: pyridoxamine 5'-phosphate oxidase family protein [Myxococcota bacterium]
MAIFHPGEQAIQRRYGRLEKNVQMAQRLLHHELPAQHAAFYPILPWVALAWVDAQDWPRLRLLSGAPGFASPRNDTHLAIEVAPGDPLRDALNEGALVGMLGLEFPTRRRNRLHGVAHWTADRLVIAIKQAYGNCPQYIQARELTPHGNDSIPRAREPALDVDARQLIDNADTFFIASAYLGPEDEESSGADASHRGGRPGFAKVVAPDTLHFVDYPGNTLFNTLGNLLEHPPCTLVFVDFNTGDLAEIRGEATIHFEHPALEGVAKGERLVEIRVRESRVIRHGFPFVGSPPELAKGSVQGGVLR